MASPSAEDLSSLYRLSDPALAELSLEPLLNELLGRIQQILEVDTVAILLIDHDVGALVARAAKGIEAEVEQRVRVPLGKGFAGRIASQRRPIYIADVAHADIVNPLLHEMGLRSLLGVPLIVEGELIGVLHVGTLTPREFGQGDTAVLELAAARAAPAIARANVFYALEREHRAAVALQRSLLPDRLPEFLDADVAARYLPARDEVGGDWYDVLALDGDSIVMAIGDVVGHGARAASLMGQLRSGLRAYALDGHGPAAVLERLDRMLQATHDRGMATAAVAILDKDTGSVRLATAGHPPPLIAGANGARFAEAKPCPPLGARSHPTYTESTFALEPDDTLLMYTDGLIEVRGENLTAGLERLRATAAGDPDPALLCDRLARTLVPPEGARDDVALVAVRPRVLPETFELRLATDPRILTALRSALRRWLQARGADDEDCRAVLLGVSEAAANAIEHAYSVEPGYFEIRFEHEGSDAIVTIRDKGAWRERRGQDQGRGLEIMRATMDDVQIRRGESGTELVLRRRIGADKSLPA